MAVVVNVIVKGDDKTHKTDYLIYENEEGPVRLTEECAILRKRVDQALVEFPGKPEEVIIKTRMTWNLS
jgi:hypothetical protein